MIEKASVSSFSPWWLEYYLNIIVNQVEIAESQLRTITTPLKMIIEQSDDIEFRIPPVTCRRSNQPFTEKNAKQIMPKLNKWKEKSQLHYKRRWIWALKNVHLHGWLSYTFAETMQLALCKVTRPLFTRNWGLWHTRLGYIGGITAVSTRTGVTKYWAAELQPWLWRSRGQGQLNTLASRLVLRPLDQTRTTCMRMQAQDSGTMPIINCHHFVPCFTSALRMTASNWNVGKFYTKH